MNCAVAPPDSLIVNWLAVTVAGTGSPEQKMMAPTQVGTTGPIRSQIPKPKVRRLDAISNLLEFGCAFIISLSQLVVVVFQSSRLMESPVS
jgi:hypothetical protein